MHAQQHMMHTQGVRLDDANLLAGGLGASGYGNDLTAGLSNLGNGTGMMGDGALLNHMGIMAQNAAYFPGGHCLIVCAFCL